jgi:hypothetical protein
MYTPSEMIADHSNSLKTSALATKTSSWFDVLSASFKMARTVPENGYISPIQMSTVRDIANSV